MRMSVWDKPRVIGCAENYPQHIALPRGCLDAALSLLRENGIACDSARRALWRSAVGRVLRWQPASRPGGCRRSDALPRRRGAVRADRLRQDGDGRRDDRPAGRQHLGTGAPHRTAQAVAGTPAGLPWRRQRCGRHHRRRQGQAHWQDRHRRDAVVVPPRRGEPAGRGIRSGDRRRVPPRRRDLLRRHPEADQGEVRARSDGDTNPPRRAATDHLHAVRADPPHGSHAGRRAARSGGRATVTLRAHRPATRRRDSGRVPSPGH